MPTEPVSAGSSAYILTGAVGAVLGPIYGPAVLMLFAASMGAMLALSREKTDSRWQAAQFIGVAIGLSLALTGSGVWLVEKFTPLPGSLALMPVAFGFAAARSMLLKFIGDLLDSIVGLFVKKLGG
jgi:NADH:ubiquinone oxidoreductase subunit 6 (subunit J)